jgi:putative permease
MIETIRNWYKRNFTDPQAVFLVLFIVVGFSIVLVLGSMLTPVFAAVVIAYILESAVKVLNRLGVRRRIAATLIFLLFLALLFFLVFGAVPFFLSQVTQFFSEVPKYIEKGQNAVSIIHERLPFISARQIEAFAVKINTEMANLGQRVLTASLTSIPGFFTGLVYLVLLPLLVFFFMKDKLVIFKWFSNYLSPQRGLAYTVWKELDRQLGNYIRGKFWEFFILGIATYICFFSFHLKYRITLSLFVGLSVIFPYVGFVIVTIPVVLIAYYQFDIGSEFYLTLDGYVLVPLLFSGVTNIHPIAIIISLLFFGGLWGFWGVVFAIPLATLVNAVLHAWPRARVPESAISDPSAAP